MNNLPLFAGTLALSLVLGPATLAQTSPADRPPPAGTYAPRTTDIPEDRDPAPSMLTDVDTADLSAKDLRDKPVYDGKNQQIATVTDVTGTPGQNRQAILKTGGLMGVGGREVALPIDKLRVGPDGRLVLNMTEDELKLLPKYR